MTIFSVNSSIKISYNMNWKYGIYEWDWKRKMPTQQIFEGWKKDFLSIPEVKNYEVWVAGGFLEEWKSPDIDIQLWGGPKDFKVIEKLLYEGTNIGITKYNIFVDVTYNWINEDKKYYGFTDDPDFNWNNLKPKKRNVLMISNILFINDKKIWKVEGTQLREGLYHVSYSSPKKKQKNRIYTQKPQKIAGIKKLG